MFMSGTSDEQGTVADIWDLGSGGGVVGPRNLKPETSPLPEPGAMQPCRSHPHLLTCLSGLLEPANSISR